MPIYSVSIDAGLERVAAEEIREVDPRAAVHEPATPGAPGRVRVEAPDGRRLLDLRTAHHVDEIRAEGQVSTADDARRVVARAALPELNDAASFRVSTSVRGDADLDRIEIQRLAGAVLCERYGTQVDLERYELEVRVDLLHGTLVVGPRLNRAPLADRVRRGRAVRSSLKATTAAALLRLVGAHRGAGRLIDPMCGAGTIPLEARRANPALRIEAADWDEPTVAVARGTFSNHDVPLRAELADARTLGERSPGAFDWIVTDPPYGMRQARRASLGDFYRRLLDSFRVALRPDGRAGIVVVKHRLFAAAAGESGLHVVDRAEVDAGSVRLRLFVLAREPEQPPISREP